MNISPWASRSWPVVAYGCVEVESHRGLIWTAQISEVFLQAIELAYHDDSQEQVARRLDLAWKNSWDERVKVMLNHIREYRAQKDVQWIAHVGVESDMDLHIRLSRRMMDDPDKAREAPYNKLQAR